MIDSSDALVISTPGVRNPSSQIVYENWSMKALTRCASWRLADARITRSCWLHSRVSNQKYPCSLLFPSGKLHRRIVEKLIICTCRCGILIRSSRLQREQEHGQVFRYAFHLSSIQVVPHASCHIVDDLHPLLYSHRPCTNTQQ